MSLCAEGTCETRLPPRSGPAPPQVGLAAGADPRARAAFPLKRLCFPARRASAFRLSQSSFHAPPESPRVSARPVGVPNRVHCPLNRRHCRAASPPSSRGPAVPELIPPDAVFWKLAESTAAQPLPWLWLWPARPGRVSSGPLSPSVWSHVRSRSTGPAATGRQGRKSPTHSPYENVTKGPNGSG